MGNLIKEEVIFDCFGFCMAVWSYKLPCGGLSLEHF